MAQVKKKPIVEIMLTPIIDVVMLLLLFFMIAYSRSSPHFYAQKVELPSSTTPEKLEEDQKILEISVDEKGQIIVNNRTMEVSEIQKFLKKRPGMEKIIVRGDQKAPYEKIILVIDQIKEAGIPRVLLLTRKKVEES